MNKKLQAQLEYLSINIKENTLMLEKIQELLEHNLSFNNNSILTNSIDFIDNDIRNRYRTHQRKWEVGEYNEEQKEKINGI